VNATYCNFAQSYPGEGNISSDPLFVDPELGDFHLRPYSPCIDAGTSDPPTPLLDFEDDPRFDDPTVPNTGGGLQTYYDMGVDEMTDPPIGVDDTLDLFPPGLAVWPNPAPSGVTLDLTLRHEGQVRVSVHDVSGRHVRLVREARLAAGRHPIVWDGRDEGGSPVPSGVYFVRLESGGRPISRRVVLVR